MLEGDKQRTEKDRYRTCCSVCHIKFGTVVLGVVESIVCIVLLVTFIQQVLWKTGGSHNCFNNILRDCLIFQFSHFSVTLIFDYIVIVMMVFILIAVCLLFFGILSDTSCLLLPHILVQGIFLLFSIGYFGLYAVSYFYGDLYVHSRPFAWNHFMERMWLATLLIVLALFQTYLFSAVIRCSMYISTIEDYRRHRATEFERCSERVRRAKENGLWRTTSWGGGFQQYKGQFEKENKQKKSTKRKGIHVQWSTQKPDVTELDETVQYERAVTAQIQAFLHMRQKFRARVQPLVAAARHQFLRKIATQSDDRNVIPSSVHQCGQGRALQRVPTLRRFEEWTHVVARLTHLYEYHHISKHTEERDVPHIKRVSITATPI
ncbi:hypothetical protein Q1695_001764 [Nippostrongylus brasiliensis]|nr:hypothetical protein Q1695_001764 [Nippostrongylus brasiliensis]